jgi:hypothetical protein
MISTRRLTGRRETKSLLEMIMDIRMLSPEKKSKKEKAVKDSMANSSPSITVAPETNGLLHGKEKKRKHDSERKGGLLVSVPQSEQ